MIQDIRSKYDLTYCLEPPRPQDPVICCRQGEIYAASVAPLAFPTADRFEGRPLTRLFRVGGDTYYLLEDEASALPEGLQPLSRRVLRSAMPQDRAFAAMTGMHLAHWYAHSRYCGKCGAAMRKSDAERAMVCPACGNTVYPAIAPAVIIGVVKNGRILVSRYANRGYIGLALLAGFCEIGETPEDTVRREVMEEVGLRVTRTVYAGSQPWGFDRDLLLGYYCEVEDGEIHADPGELKEAWWMPREEIGPLSDSASLTFHLMARYRDGFEPFAPDAGLAFRHARKEELPEIMRIYAGARAFMAAHGNPRQWGQSGWPPEAVIDRDIDRGRLYVCTADDRLQGVFYYDFALDAEPGYRGIEDGQWSVDAPYGVVHRMASAGRRGGVGAAIIAWAFRQAGYLRIDTHPDNRVMQALLSRCGFTRRGIIHVTEDSDPRYAYEKIS